MTRKERSNISDLVNNLWCEAYATLDSERNKLSEMDEDNLRDFCILFRVHDLLYEAYGEVKKFRRW